jgi:Zn-dependent protease with chaperone function
MTIRLGVAIALSLSAGVIAWAGGRRMLREADDPLFVDRLFAHRVAMIRIYFVLIIAAAVLAPEAALWLGPVALLSIAVGGFPARKTLYSETWSLPQYLGSRIRLIAFAGGPWLALLFAPYAIEHIGARWAPAVFAIVFALFLFQQTLLLFGLRSELLRDEGLISRLEPIIEKTQAPRPTVFVGGSETGRAANAFALPAGKRSRVVLTRALLRTLEPAETAAIFAHEAAHLEQYAKKGMRIRVWIGRLLMPLLAVVPQALVMTMNPEQAKWLSLIWPLIFLFAIVAALIRRQVHEGEADLRALQLGADPLALISGLEKIHRSQGTPRRLDAPREQRMSHPSLARRIQAIRRAAGLEIAAPPALPQVITARKPAPFIRFTADALEMFDRAPDESAQPVRAYRYDALHSLVLRKTLGGWELMGRAGKERIRVPIAANTAVAVQNILDSIDSRFAHAPIQPRIARSARLTALLVLLLSLFPGIAFPPIIASIITLVSAGAPALAALGTTAIAAGLMALTHPSMPFLENVIPAIAAAEALFGIICLLLIRKIAVADRHRHLHGTLITLGVMTAIVIIPSLITISLGQPMLRLFLVARDRPSAPILLIGIAAALVVSGRRRVAAAPAIAALTLLICGTRMFATMSGGDPLLSTREPSWVAPPKPSLVRKIDEKASELLLSPSGEAFAVRPGDDEDEDRPLDTTEATAKPVVYATMTGGVTSPWLLMFSQAGIGSEFWRTNGRERQSLGRSVLQPGVTLRLPDSRGWAVVGYDTKSTYVGTIEEDGKSIRASGTIEGRAYGVKAGTGSRIVMHTPTAAFVWNLATGKAMRLSCTNCMVLDVALSDHGAGVLFVRGQTTTLEIYPTSALR